MAQWVFYLLVAVAAYLFGSIPWGLIIASSRGIDIRAHGSGNIGATNVRRVMGKGWGRLCFLLDFLKGLLPVLAVKILAKEGVIPNWGDLAVILAALGVVAGHNWSLYLKFKGGKGVATTMGLLLIIAPLSLLIFALVWVVVFYMFRYVSLASIVGTLTLPLSAWLLSISHVYHMPETLITFLGFLAILSIVRHAGNIKRLLEGTENRFEKKPRIEVEHHRIQK